jgi:hypothetical protein
VRKRFSNEFPPEGLYNIALLTRLLKFVKEKGKCTLYGIRNSGELRHHDTVRKYVQFCVDTRLMALDKAESWGGKAGFRRFYAIRPEGEQFLALFEAKQQSQQQQQQSFS